jgi:phosphoribosyl 1,2-cyclic phosphate phosphodiesterase
MGAVPKLELVPIRGAFRLGTTMVEPIEILHGRDPILGFRIGSLAYLTDCSAIPEASCRQLGDLDVLVLDALRDRPHPTHFTVAQAVEMAGSLAPRMTYFTHMSHDLPHEATCARLPPGMQLAYDGLSLDFEAGAP